MNGAPRYYVGTHESADVYAKSSSGGAFTALTDDFFSRNPSGAVYGCCLDESLDAVHRRVTTPEGRDSLRGSKYIPSHVGTAYLQVAHDLAEGTPVVFCGTPCQVAALNAYLRLEGASREGLLAVSFACHGVASPRFWHDYIAWLEGRFGAPAVAASFRAKSRPGKLQDMRVEFSNGRMYQAASTRADWFYSIYHADLILRSACFSCPYACTAARPADVDIADAWGSAEVGGRACSLLVPRTAAGEEWVERVKGVMGLVEVGAGEVNQPHFVRPVSKPAGYDEFWQVYEEGGFMAAQRWFGNATPKGRVRAAAISAADKLGVRELMRKVKR